MRFRNFALALLTLLLVSLLAISFGPIHISFLHILETIFNLPGKLQGSERTVLLDIRAPRVVLAILVGSALSTSGAVYQTVFKNPLADPYLLGAAAGAGLGYASGVLSVNVDASSIEINSDTLRVKALGIKDLIERAEKLEINTFDYETGKKKIKDKLLKEVFKALTGQEMIVVVNSV